MKKWQKVGLAAAGAVAAGAAVAAIRNHEWNSESMAVSGRLSDAAGMASPPGDAQFYDPELCRELPDPVRRYLNYSLTPGQRLPRLAHSLQTGALRPNGENGAWYPFTATQDSTVKPVAFVWVADIHVGPVPLIAVRDAYVDGAGATDIRMLALFDAHDRPASPHRSEAALHRYLAESPWLPTALLPGGAVTWTPVDQTKARATICDHGHCASLTFEFGPNGEILSSVADERYRDVAGDLVPTPWRCSYHGSFETGDIRVPRSGEVAWLIGGEWRQWLRVEVDSLVFQDYDAVVW